MRIMCSKRGGKLFATNDRYCVNNGATIVYTGLLAYANETSTLLEESTFTQQFRTDEVLAIWREKKESSNGLTKNDQLKGLQVLPSLVRLGLWDAYDWEQLYFEVGGFLKQLYLEDLKGLNSVIIKEGALSFLEELTIGRSPHLKEVPAGIHHLQKLKTLRFLKKCNPNPNPTKAKTTGSSSISLVYQSGPNRENLHIPELAIFKNISIRRWRIKGSLKLKTNLTLRLD
ncbi:hypothetical protein ACSBR2_030326 [Camellia fascicularis]